jgi:signal transduction histidine kinase
MAIRLIEKNPAGLEFHRMIEFMNRQVNRIVQLIDELLDMVRVDTGKMHYSFEKMDLEDLANELVGRFSAPALSRGSKVFLDSSGSQSILGDRFRLSKRL